jgi:hypothetical protein
LRIAGGGRSVGDGIGDGVQVVDNGVGGCDCWDGEVMVTKINCVWNVEGFDLGVNDPVAAIVFEGDAHVETVWAVEVPGAACRRIVVNDDRAAGWLDGGGVVIKEAIEVLPGRHAKCDGGLAK